MWMDCIRLSVISVLMLVLMRSWCGLSKVSLF